ncbi:uncharacterized protein LOC126981424 isoform X3 [Eriocheir sinensis]|uniref:uncharacterized protein LOC126981424 isoform X3 n=1 Tax=Eriocheir sinensis TaxID=95602 RepID=UPI0021C7F1C5|nr:uncharacterized protein LOC126981424 isoform X3 [Eriocheir sinensis]
MASLLPSEVARLVLGYVEENKCEKTSAKLQEELPVLAECALQRRKGRKVPLRVGSQNLEDMLADYSASKDYVLESVQNYSSTLKELPRSGSLLSQVQALVAIIINNKDAIKQNKATLGPIKNYKQQRRMVRLQNDLRMRTHNAQCHTSQQLDDQLSATPAEDLPGSSHRDSGYVEHAGDHCGERYRLRSHSHPSGSLPSASHSGHDVEEARQDSFGGDSTSMSLMQDLDTSHQRRKGIVKRRNQSAEQTPVKMSPGLDNEANFEKILKNLYENTALHEKIAENINRGLSTQCKLGHVPGEVDEDNNSLSFSSAKKGRDCSSSSIDGRERNCGVVEPVPGTSGGGDAAFLKEFEHIVTGIISETTSDPVFECLIDEVFGCSSPQSGISKGDDGSAGFGQGSTPEPASGPSRLLSTPVPPPPPSSTPSSHSLLPIAQTVPPHQSPVTCHQSPAHNLSTPHIHMSPVNDTSPCLSPTSESHVHHAPMPSFSPGSHPTSSLCKPFPSLPSPKKIDMWANRNLSHENMQVAKDKTQTLSSLRDTVQESLQNASSDSMREDMSSSWSSSVRLESGSSCLTKHTVAAAPSLSCNQKSPPLREGNDGSKTTSFSPPATRLSRRKKSKQNCSTKSKEDENNLGEQLLKEFADFQSSRSDKVDGCEESGKLRSDDQSEAPEEANLTPIELPTEKETANDQEGEGNLKVPSKESTPTSQPRHETQIAGLENTNLEQACQGAPVGGEDAHAGDEGHSGTGQVEMEMETQTAVEPETEPAISSEALAVNVCHSDSKLKEVNKEVQYNNESHALKLNSAPVPLVRSNTIPGLVPSVSSSEENTYTITELAPAAPLDLTSLVSSMCSVDGYDISYPDPTHASAASWSAQTPSSSVVQSANVWDPTEVTQHSLVQQDTDAQRNVESQPKPLTVFLPPVATRKEAEKQLMNFVNEGGFKTMNIPTFTAPLSHSITANKLTGNEIQFHTTSAYPGRLMHTIAPKMASSYPLSQGPADGTEKVSRFTTYTLANNITFTVPEVATLADGPENKGAKGKGSRKTSAKKKTKNSSNNTGSNESKPKKTRPTKSTSKKNGPNKSPTKKTVSKKSAPKKTGSNKSKAKKTTSKKSASKEGESGLTTPQEVTPGAAAESVKPKSSATKKTQETKTNKGKKATPKKRQKTKNKSEAKKPSQRSRKSSKENQESEANMSDNNIISVALSFALNSVTPKKNESLPEEPPTGETSHDGASGTGVSAESVEGVTAETKIVTREEAGSGDPSLSATGGVSGEHTLSRTGLASSEPDDMAAATSDSQGSPGEASCSMKNSGNEVVQASSTEHIAGNTAPQSTSKQKQVSRKFNSGRSPQLKALLELSRSLSPSKRALALKESSQSEESPCIRTLHMRGSQSTPSRKNSHIRVLDFTTPQKRSAFTRSPRRAVTNLKFSPPAGLRFQRNSRKFSQNPAAKPEALKKIAEEESAVTKTIDKEHAVSDKGKLRAGTSSPRKSSPRGSRISPCVRPRSDDRKSDTKCSNSRQTSVGSLSKVDFLDPKHSSLLLSEDEENIVLHLEGEDSLSSCGKSPASESGSVHLFDLPRVDSQGFNFNMITNDPNSDSLEDELPDLMGTFAVSDIVQHSGARPKQMETPSKAAATIPSISLSPVCLEPPTPILPSEQKSNSNTCDDLHTPVPMVVPNVTRTPLIKDYPQGPYSSSSVCSSYYMPSERSFTESEDSPNKLDTLEENAEIEELDSLVSSSENDSELNNTVKYAGSAKSSKQKSGPGHGAKNDVAKSTPKRSPAKLPGKEMGELIEQEMLRLFSGQESSSPTKEPDQVDTPSLKCSASSDSNSRDSSKGKQGKKRRMPSMKYQILVDSTCSEDETDVRSENRLPSVSSSKRRSNEVPAARLKLKKGSRNHCGKADEKEVEQAQGEKPTSDLKEVESSISESRRKTSEMENTDDSMTRTPRKKMTSISEKTENRVMKKSPKRKLLTLESKEAENSKTESQRERETSGSKGTETPRKRQSLDLEEAETSEKKLSLELEEAESSKAETPENRLSLELEEAESSKAETPENRLSLELEEAESSKAETPENRLSLELEKAESSKAETPENRLSLELEKAESSKAETPENRLFLESEEAESSSAETPEKRLYLESEETESSDSETPEKRTSLESEKAASSKAETTGKRLSLESEKAASSKPETTGKQLSLESEKAASSKAETTGKRLSLESEKAASSKPETTGKQLSLESEEAKNSKTETPGLQLGSEEADTKMTVTPRERVALPSDVSPKRNVKKGKLTSHDEKRDSPLYVRKLSAGGQAKEKEEAAERNPVTKPLPVPPSESVTDKAQCEGSKKIIYTIEDVFGSDVSSSDDSNLKSPSSKENDSDSGDSFSSKPSTPVEGEVHVAEEENQTTLRRSNRSTRNRGVSRFQSAEVLRVQRKPFGVGRGRANGRQAAPRGRGRRGGTVHIEEVVIEAIFGTSDLSSKETTPDGSEVAVRPKIKRGLGARRPGGGRARGRSRSLIDSPESPDEGAQKEGRKSASAPVYNISDSSSSPEASDKSREDEEHEAASELDTNKKGKDGKSLELQQNEGHELQQSEGHELQQNEDHGLQENEGHELQQNEDHGLQENEGHGLQQNEDHELQQNEDHGLQQNEDHGLQENEDHELQQNVGHELQQKKISKLSLNWTLKPQQSKTQALQQTKDHESPQTEDHESPQTEESNSAQNKAQKLRPPIQKPFSCWGGGMKTPNSSEDSNSAQNKAQELRPPIQKPFSCWGGGMKTPNFSAVRNHTTLKPKNFRILWSSNSKESGTSVSVKTINVGDHSTEDQPHESSSQCHQLPQEDNSLHSEVKVVKEKQCESTQPQPQTKATPGSEHEKRQLPASTSQPHLPQEDNSLHSEVKVVKEKQCESTQPEPQNKATPGSEHEKGQLPASTSRPHLPQEERARHDKKQTFEPISQPLKTPKSVQTGSEEIKKHSSASSNQTSQLTSNTPVVGKEIKKQSSSSSNQASQPKRKNTVDGSKKTMEWPTSSTQTSKPKNSSSTKSEGKEGMKNPILSTTETSLLKQKNNNSNEEVAKEKNSSSTHLAPQLKRKRSTSREEGAEEKLSSSSHQASHPKKGKSKRNNNPCSREEGMEGKPSPSLPQPLQPQKKRETPTQRSPQSQGCARLIVFTGPSPNISLHRLREEGDLGQVINVTPRLHLKEKRKSPKVPQDKINSAAKSSSKRKRAAKSTPEAAVEQESVLKPSPRKRSLTSSSRHEGDRHGPQASPLPTSLTPDCRTGMAKLNADSTKSKNVGNDPQSSLQARLKQANEGRSSKKVKGKNITQASGKERISSANKSFTLVPSGRHETEKTSKAHKGTHDSAKTSSKNCGTKTDVPPAEMSSPVRTVSSHSDAEENSKEHCLMTYTALPSTPEKKVGRICHSIVKEGKAMVAFPSPSKPHSVLPNLMIPQRSLFRDQTDTAEQPQSFSSTSCSLQGKSGGEGNQGSRRMFDDYSQLNFSNKIVMNDAAENLHQGERKTAKCNLIRKTKESISINSVGGDHHGPQNEEGSKNSDILQGTANERMLTDLREFTNVRQEDYIVHGSQSSSHFTGDDDEEKVEEEEDSDVLRIEEHSENEYEDVEVISKIELQFSNMIDIFSLNLDHEKEIQSKQHTPSPPTTKQKKKEKSSTSPRRKTPAQGTRKAPTKSYLTPVTPKRPLARKRRSSGATPGCHALTEKGRTKVGRASIQSLTSHKFQSSTEEEAGCYAGRSRPVERKRESHTSTEKRRRITPIRIGDVESRGKVGTPKEPHWGHNRGGAGVHWETTEGRGSAWGQLERFGGRGGLSERSVSSLSSISPGRLLISESPRGPDSSPAALSDFAAPINHTLPSLPLTTVPATTTPPKTRPVTAPASPMSSTASWVSSGDPRLERQGTNSQTYIIESEASREVGEDNFLGRQRKARHMAQELHRGGILEIARSPDKQLAIMTSHLQGGSLHMSEESLLSLPRTPPTPGKHLFIPPPPSLPGIFSNSSSSSSYFHSQSRQDSINLPPKKRRELVFTSDQGKPQEFSKDSNI